MHNQRTIYCKGMSYMHLPHQILSRPEVVAEADSRRPNLLFRENPQIKAHK